MEPEKYILEVPIYRLSQQGFSKDYERDLEKHFFQIFPRQGRAAASKDIQLSIEQSFRERYGMPWRYNQIVGWIRVYILGSQVRGELWFTKAEKLMRRPAHRQIVSSGKAFEIHPLPSDTSSQIGAQVRDEILDSVKEIGGNRLLADLESFDNLSPHLDWHSLAFG